MEMQRAGYATPYIRLMACASRCVPVPGGTGWKGRALALVPPGYPDRGLANAR
jgi:hypothetical protein